MEGRRGFLGGCWDGYMAKLVEFLNGHRNVHISVTAGILDHPTFKQDDFISLCANFPNRVVLGTTARGYFTKKQETAWEKKGYMEQCRRLHQFADILAERFGTDVARAVRFGNAARLFGMPGANDGTLSSIALDQHPVVTPEAPEDGLHEDHKARVNMAAHYGSGKCSTMQKHLESAPSSLTTQAPSLAPAGKKEWESVDCHFHLFDFSQKSCGTAAALRALDEAKAEKAVLLGIPCCKKWNSNQKECPLFYTDDNAPCYFYSFADQMMVDAWLALPDKSRRRLAPLISGFDPTDKNSINHVKRTYEKYPRLWRGLGEIMCRHDDLTSTMMNKEVPVPNHPALDSIYTFCCEKQLPVMVHSNADRVAHKSTGRLEYAPEVTSVLDRFPSLIFIWCHAGVSRQTADQHQAHHIDDLMTKYPNLHADISWVVWEQSICDENGEIKQDWLDVIEKHSDRFMIGSDNTGQFWTPDLKKNTLKGQITKYWPLYEKLSPQAAQRVSCGNGERIFFSSWTVPLSTDEDARYHTGPRCYPCEFLDMFEREYIPGQGDDAMF
ncbi:unnamed protein product [Prorocentrum cordatum]|uniref:Amidohydrolase-related domain-containing protein n=1 Tax=Prorocentrum cordatum TaxID=2364126 RepID=A0ABN9TN58_9DINO|nr:unnamed protein product [Polarella glacialis]